MPSERDEEIAVIFREMRRASEMSPEQLSARLKTPLASIEALEAGDIAALPEWRETSRIITAYAGFLGLDSRPILRRLKAHRAAAEGAEPPSPPAQDRRQDGDGEAPQPSAPPRPEAAPSPEPPPAGPPMPPGAARVSADAAPLPQGVPPDPRRAAAVRPSAAAASPAPPGPPPPRNEARASDAAGRGRARRPPRRAAGRLATWLLLLVVFAAMGLGVRYAVGHPQAVWSGVDELPDPAPRMVRSVWALLHPGAGGARGSASGVTITAGGKADKVPGGRAPRDN